MSAAVRVELLRWYTLDEILALDARTSAVLLTATVRENGGEYGGNIASWIRARGERVEEVRARRDDEIGVRYP